MVRGVRGATTVLNNEENEILEATKELFKEVIEKNKIDPNSVAHVIITVTEDLNATFPAKVLRTLSGWTYVPVMCSTEIPVPNGLPKCIRVMLTVNTDLNQEEINHIYLREAVRLRPDLQLTDTHNQV
ncbi:chorismate mutase [Anaerobacillus alkalilacustris]|uniref:chorismate mutase n=1 Tax=Anaerobacillus alkalilacustris TaxID=393763 RepID=A0A1S2LRH7_9BACI|nr:chorismate mutase [Anaerobacillus alkalilacustris]OIJ14810.1 chorismate mutase [Anaerobacillus alkalilacustris]